MRDTITLDIVMDFNKALTYMLEGKCLGIKPGNNSNYVVKYKPNWMNPDCDRYCLKWNGKEENLQITTEQFLGDWFPVIVNHNKI